MEGWSSKSGPGGLGMGGLSRTHMAAVALLLASTVPSRS